MPINDNDRRIARADHRIIAEIDRLVFGGDGFGHDRKLPIHRPEPPTYFLNEGTTSIPAHGLIEITGRRFDNGRRTLTGRRPSSTLVSKYAVNFDRNIASGVYGRCHTSGMCLALYGEGAPANDQLWGPKPNEAGLFKGFPGVGLVYGVHDPDRQLALIHLQPITTILGKMTAAATPGSSTSNWQVYAGTIGSETATSFTAPTAYTRAGIPDLSWVLAFFQAGGLHLVNISNTQLLGKSDSAITKASSGTVSIWTGTPGSESDSTVNVTAYNRFADVESGKWVWVSHNGYGWYLTAAEC